MPLKTSRKDLSLKSVLITVLVCVVMFGVVYGIVKDDVEYVEVIVEPMSLDFRYIETSMRMLEEDVKYDVELHENGYAFYKMPKEEHEEMMIKLNQDFSGVIDSIVEEKRYEYVHGISFSSDFTLFEVIVDGDEYRGGARYNDLVLLLSSFGTSYGLKNGEQNVHSEVSFLDVKDGELVGTKAVY
jgi:hypothetical protein